MDSDEATALNKRYCDRKQELKEDFKPDDYNGMGHQAADAAEVADAWAAWAAVREKQARWIRTNFKLDLSETKG